MPQPSFCGTIKPRMSTPLTRPRPVRDWASVGSLAGLLGLVVLGGVGVQIVLSGDPLASFRAANTPFPAREGVILQNFELLTYQKGQRVAEAKVDRAVLMSDRSTVELLGLRNGILRRDDGTQFQFTAARANYGTYSRSILADGGITLSGKDLNLKADGFIYDHARRQITIRGAVTGLLVGGQLQAENVVISLEEGGGLEAGPVVWTGKLAMQDAPSRNPWRIESKRVQMKGDTATYLEAKGQDRDTLIQAQRMTHDRAKDVVKAEGNVQYFGIDANLSCDEVTLFRRERRAILTGTRRVTMLVKPKDSAPAATEIPPLPPPVPNEIAAARPQESPETPPERRQDNLRQYPVAIEAARIEYWYREGQRRAEVSGSPRARQQLAGGAWRDLVAHAARYDGERERLTLTSRPGQRDVRMRNSLQDDLSAFTITVSTREGEDELEGEGITGTVMIDDEDVPGRTGTGSTGTTGTTGSSGGSRLRGPIGR